MYIHVSIKITYKSYILIRTYCSNRCFRKVSLVCIHIYKKGNGSVPLLTAMFFSKTVREYSPGGGHIRSVLNIS